MINNVTEKPAVKLNSQRQVLFHPQDGWSYAHHAFITAFQGKLYAAWSNGRINEDDCGQRVLLSQAEDFEHWSEPVALIDPAQSAQPEQVLTAAGFYTDGGSLHLYYGHYRYDPSKMPGTNQRPPVDGHHLETGVGYVTLTPYGDCTEPRELGMPAIPNHGPQPTHTGRLIVSGGIMFPYSDDSSGVGKYTLSGIYGDAFDGTAPFDDSEAVQLVTARRKWDTKLICEGSFYQTDDHVLHMMLRSNTERLWCSESRDDGVTWAEPFPTNFSDDGSKFHFGRLPDGRFYYVGNPVFGGGRNPLMLCLSKDGVNFDTHYILRDEPYDKQFPGMYKGGLYGYPHTLIHDGKLYVIYSKRKECIEATCVSIDQLA